MFIYPGLEPKTVLSQWYPHKGLYGRDVEGMHLLLEVPSILSTQLKVPPKPLIPGCIKIFRNCVVVLISTTTLIVLIENYGTTGSDPMHLVQKMHITMCGPISIYVH